MADGGREAQQTDVLVIFGITGDLAKVMTFRSLYRLEQRGLLRLPDRRRRRRRLDASSSSIERARDVDRRHRRAARRGGLRAPRRAALVRARGLLGRRDLRACRHGDRRQDERRFSIWRSRPSSSATVVKGLADAGLTEDGARRGREAVRARPGVRARSGRRAPSVRRRVAAPQHRPLPREDGDRGDPLPALRERDARAGLEPELRLVASRSRWPRTSASRTAATSTIRSGRCATSWSITSCRSSALCAMEAPARGDPQTIKDAQLALFRAIAEADPATTCAGSTTATARSTASRPTRRRRRTPRFGSTSRTGAGPGVPFFIRTGKRLPVTQTELRLVFKHPPSSDSALRSRTCEPNQLVVKLDPSTRHQDRARSASRRMAPGPIELDMEFAAEGGEGPTPYEVLLHAAMVGQTLAVHQQDAVEETWRVMQPLLDAPPPVHLYAPGSWGPEGSGRRWSPGTVAGATPGSRRDQGCNRGPGGAAERRRAVAVPTDRRLRVPFELPHRRARGSGRRDRLALRPFFDAPSIFGSLLDRQAGSSGSARSGSTIRPTANTCRGRTCS